MSSGGVARTRLTLERKNWRKDHPIGFVAKPMMQPDGFTDILTWQCKIPGKAGTKWEDGVYPLTLKFTENYPSTPPEAYFPADFIHPNVYCGGKVCLSIINDSEVDGTWAPSITVKEILLGIQDLLDCPNLKSPANWEIGQLALKKQAEYIRIIKNQVKKYVPVD